MRQPSETAGGLTAAQLTDLGLPPAHYWADSVDALAAGAHRFEERQRRAESAIAIGLARAKLVLPKPQRPARHHLPPERLVAGAVIHAVRIRRNGEPLQLIAYSDLDRATQSRAYKLGAQLGGARARVAKRRETVRHTQLLLTAAGGPDLTASRNTDLRLRGSIDSRGASTVGVQAVMNVFRRLGINCASGTVARDIEATRSLRATPTGQAGTWLKRWKARLAIPAFRSTVRRAYTMPAAFAPLTRLRRFAGAIGHLAGRRGKARSTREGLPVLARRRWQVETTRIGAKAPSAGERQFRTAMAAPMPDRLALLEALEAELGDQTGQHARLT